MWQYVTSGDQVNKIEIVCDPVDKKGTRGQVDKTRIGCG
jgi:hypothetical protein